MVIMEQLELFQTRDLQKEMDSMKKDIDKTRKALFAKQADLIKRHNELSHDYEILKLQICKGKIIV